MKSIKLSEIRPGNSATILKIIGGRGINGRLAGMGLHVGFEVKVIESSRNGCGALVVGMDDTRLMLGSGMAEKIIVRAV